MPEQTPLVLRFLGDVEVMRGGEPLALPHSKKTRALLAYLVVTGRPHRRERLCDLLWDIPDDPRGALRWSLSKLRPVVDAPDRKRIMADRESVAFDAGGTEIDVVELRNLLATDIKTLPVDVLEEAVRAFRGEFLDGLEIPNCPEYQAWCTAEREDARKRHATLLRELVRRHAARPEAALVHARSLVRVDPYDEGAHVLLAELLAATGRHDEAELHHRAASGLFDGDGEPSDAPSAPAATTPSTGAGRPGVAVLPFDNLSGDPEQEYFVDGLTEDIITALSLWKSFPVIARYSTFSYKGQAVDIRKVGEELGARYVLEGSVRKAASRIRISAQLINSETGHHVWAERYDRDLADIFDLQEEISHRIVATLVPELERSEREKSAAKAPANLDAWDFYLQGSALLNDLRSDVLPRARAVRAGDRPRPRLCEGPCQNGPQLSPRNVAQSVPGSGRSRRHHAGERAIRGPP